MAAFRYQYGDRPLEGYAIQRAVGRGGFGEVYYALSDSGREVALKVIQSYEQIELRGVSQCMNLKSPHLVSIFDVKKNADGVPFVIMEYVSGPSLRELLDESPAGLGPQKAAFFLREIAKGLTFLHDRGIVHRDLKPGNIFYEDGYVKIGDYGLSKAISESHCSGQTITVGTVHYMAPEIGQGRYDKSIDIYALGVVLYEMLTGQTPYLGATPTEVLMKHLMSEPGVSGIEEPFATVIRKAMAKDPAERYQSAQEMVEAIFGAEHVRNSVSHFRPESLSVAAERVADKVALPGTGSSGEARLPGGGGAAVATGSSGPGAPNVPTPARGRDESWEEYGRRMGQWGEEVGRRWGEWGEQFGERIAAKGERFRGRLVERRERIRERLARREGRAGTAPQTAVCDPLDWNQRRLLGITTAALMGAGSAFIANTHAGNPLWLATFAFVVIAAAGGAIVGAGHRWLPNLEGESGLIRRIVFTGAAALCVLPLTFPYFCSAAGGLKIGVIEGFIVGLIALPVLLVRKQRCAKGADPQAKTACTGRLIYIVPMLFAAVLPFFGLTPGQRSGSLNDKLGATLLCAGVAAFLMNWRGLLIAAREERVSLGSAFWPALLAWIVAQVFGGDAMLAGGIMAGVALVVQVTTPFEPQAARRRRELLEDGQTQPAAEAAAGLDPARAGSRQSPAGTPAAARGERWRSVPRLAGSEPRALRRPVPAVVTAICVGLFVLFAGGGILLLSWVGLANRMNDQETAFIVSLGVASLASALFCLFRGLRRTYRSAWSGFIRPLLMLFCMQVVFAASMFMGTANLHDDELLIPLTFIVFPGLLLLVLFFLPERTVTSAFTGRQSWPSDVPSRRRRFPALVLAAVGFAGLGGLHRFYAGRTASGVLWLVTFGLLGFGTIIDIILLLTGEFRDREGRPLLIWYSEDELREFSTERAVAAEPAMAGAAPAVPFLVPPAAAPQADAADGTAPHRAGPPAAIFNAELPPISRPDPQLSITSGIQRVTSLVLATVAGLVLMSGLLLGLLAAIRFPAIIAAGWPDPRLAADLQREFGTANWPAIATTIGELVSIGLMAAAMLLIAVARRRSATVHVMRGMLGSTALILSCQALKVLFVPVDWFRIVNASHQAGGPGPWLEQVLRSLTDTRMAIAFVLLMVGGQIALVWAERRHDRAAAEQGEEQ